MRRDVIVDLYNVQRQSNSTNGLAISSTTTLLAEQDVFSQFFVIAWIRKIKGAVRRVVVLIPMSALHTTLVLMQEGSFIICKAGRLCSRGRCSSRGTVRFRRSGVSHTGVGCESLTLGSTLKILTGFQVMLSVVTMFFCKFSRFGNPFCKPCLSGSFPCSINSQFDHLLHFSVFCNAYGGQRREGYQVGNEVHLQKNGNRCREV
jgi:hypothetical protein